MSEAGEARQRVAARDALAARTRKLTGGALAVAAILSGVFAAIAAASAPGHKLLQGRTARRPLALNARSVSTAASTSTAIPPLPAPPGPGNLSAAPPPSPAPAPAPSATQAPPVAVSGGS